MQLTGVILILVSCLLITYQDFKTRLIHLISFLLLGLGIVIFILPTVYFLYPLYLLNLFFCAFLIIILKSYIHIRKGRDEDLINKYIGSGDIIMLVMLCFLFSPSTYVSFLLISCIAGILYWVLKRSRGKPEVPIPLAGIMTVLLIVALGHSLYFAYDLATVDVIHYIK